MDQNTKRKSHSSYPQAVILEVILESGEELGNDSEHEAIMYLKDKISSVLKDDEIVDGHDFGEGQATVYVYGPSADDLFESIREILKKSVFDRFEVTLQYGPAEDPKTIDKKFTVA